MADTKYNVNCGFFDAVDNDRTYTADQMNLPYKRIISNGVFATPEGIASTDLQVVSAVNGMNIIVNSGEGLFAGKWFNNPSDITITVPGNSGLTPRYDSVIAQVDETASGRVGNIVYRTGTAATSPVPPSINTEENITEYRLANIYVAPSANAINNDAITDCRGSSECPWVTSLIYQVDTSTLWNQFLTAYQNQYAEYQSDYEEYVEQQRQAWEDFISGLTSELTVQTNVVKLTSAYTTDASSTRTISINIASYNPSTDILQVFINGLLAVESSDYVVNSSGTEIVLTNALSAGQDVYFVVFKSLVNAGMDSVVSLIQNLDDKVSNFMADSGWITFTLENGASAYNSTVAPAVRCIGNRVYIRGAFKGITATGTTICTLPLAYAPAVDHVYTTAVSASGTANDYVTITISATDGTIKLSNKSGTITATNMISLATSFLAHTGISVGSVYTYKGSVSTYADLPSSGLSVGDVYMVETANATYNIAAGDDVMWNGSEWELLQTVINSSEIDTIIDTIS